MFNANLRQADLAIRGGRLDEAAALLAAPATRDQRRAQPLIDRLVSALVERGNQHADAGRPSDARSDAQLAQRLGGRQLAIMELNARVAPQNEVARHRQGRRQIDPATLTIDGLGRLALFVGDELSIGTRQTRPYPMIGLQTAGDIDPVWVRRTGDDNDFHCTSPTPVVVNDQQTRETMLRHGDRLGIGDGGRLRFLRSVPASGTVVWELTGVRAKPADARFAVWLDDSIVLGPAARGESPLSKLSRVGAHFRVTGLDAPVMIVRDGNDMMVRVQGPSRRSEVMIPGIPLAVDGISIAYQPAQETTDARL